MADISFSSSNVKLADGGKSDTVTFGEAITRGQAIFKDLTDSNKYKLADSDAVEKTKGVRFALTDGGDGQKGIAARKGNLSFGGGLVSGTIYMISDTAGGIKPIVDSNVTQFLTIAGIADSSANLPLNFIESGVTTVAS